MTKGPADINDRIAKVRQIEDVVVALRGMVAAHAREARRHLTTIREHTATVARAMVSALNAAPYLVTPTHLLSGEHRHLLIVVGAARALPAFITSISPRSRSIWPAIQEWNGSC